MKNTGGLEEPDNPTPEDADNQTPEGPENPTPEDPTDGDDANASGQGGSGSGSTDSDNAPKTGDTTNPLIPAAAAGLAFAAAAVIAVRKRRAN